MYVPMDTAKLFEKCQRDIRNPCLLFSKFIEKIDERSKGKFFKLIQSEINKLNRTKKDIFAKRLRDVFELLKAQNYKVEVMKYKVQWRLVIGLGGTHPYETSMTFHHIYGIPYIPASAVKGVTRNWVIQEKFGSEEKALECKEFKEIFGTQEKQGKVIFFDAYPVEDIHLAIDIMNPHYPEYYVGKEFPTDWQNPRPIKFLTVENTKFQFLLASEEKGLLDKAKAWLKEALKESGIGAKTSLGYGIFE